MAEISEDVKKSLFEKNPKVCCRVSSAFTYFGAAFMVIGIVGDAMNKVPGLEPTTWLIMAVIFLTVGIWAWFTAYFGAKEGVNY